MNDNPHLKRLDSARPRAREARKHAVFLSFPSTDVRLFGREEAKIDDYQGWRRSFFERSTLGGRWRSLWSQQVKLAPIQQFPLDGFTTLQTNGGS